MTAVLLKWGSSGPKAPTKNTIMLGYNKANRYKVYKCRITICG